MISALLQEPLPSLVLSLGGGLVFASVLVALVRRRAPWWLGLGCGLLPLVCVYAASSTHRLCSYHGLYHASVIYGIANGNIPPGDFLFAGAPLSYPWGAHVLLALAVKWIALPPFAVFMVQNALCLLMVVFVGYWIAGAFCEGRDERVLLTAVPLFGVTFLPLAWLNAWLTPLGYPVLLRGTIPIVDRFTNANTMPIGVALFWLYFLFLLRCFGERRPAWSLWCAGGLLIFVTAILYPFALAGAIGASAGACGALLIAGEGRQQWRRMLALAVAGGIACSAALPFMLILMEGKSEGAGFHLTSDPSRLLHKFVQQGLILMVPALILLWKRAALREAWSGHRRQGIIALGAASFLLLMNLFVSAPDGTEYKWRGFGLMIVGLGVGLCVADILKRRLVVGGVICAFLLALLGHAVLQKACLQSRVAEGLTSDGAALVARDPAEARLWHWVREKTEPDAVFVDSAVEVPYLGQRELFVGRDQPDHTGWTYPPTMWLRDVHGREPAEIDARAAVTAEILRHDGEPVSEEAIAALRDLGRPIYVLTRSKEVAGRLEGDGRFAVALREGACTVFKLR